MRRFVLGLLFVGMVVALSGCGGAPAGSQSFSGNPGKLKVAASFYPMYEFAKQVGGEKIDLVEMVPAGVEPHDWEPTAAQLKTLNQAALFVYNGAGMESWVDKSLQSLDNKKIVALDTSRHVAPGEGDKSVQTDPHLWLDPLAAAGQVEAIRQALVQIDPPNKATYDANAAAFIADLQKLDGEYRAALKSCRQTQFFTSHAAFGHLAMRYAITQKAIMGLAPDAEPTPQDLAQIVSQAKADGVKYIFFETLVSPKMADLVAGEIGAKTLVLNPLEGLTSAEQEAGRSYLSVMRENLANLKIALECGN